MDAACTVSAYTNTECRFQHAQTQHALFSMHRRIMHILSMHIPACIDSACKSAARSEVSEVLLVMGCLVTGCVAPVGTHCLPCCLHLFILLALLPHPPNLPLKAMGQSGHAVAYRHRLNFSDIAAAAFCAGHI